MGRTIRSTRDRTSCRTMDYCSYTNSCCTKGHTIRSGCSTRDYAIPMYLLLRDILLTQREVLSAMLYAQTEEKGAAGVLITENGTSARVPARPMPNRDLWFERVWKSFQEGRLD